ncbi:TerB family tellurite resistance protein [Marinicella sp. W31]|uniref:tellurite resistance TerB family protein n=1 Tax=Marinicella sp. W31 TaxID=3023713 RepID=UPI003756B16B
MKLLNTIKELFKVDTIPSDLQKSEKRELNQAIVELMVEMVRADFVELQAEKALLSQVIQETLEVDAERAGEIIERAEMRNDYSLSLKSQTAVINNYMPKQQKKTLIANLWQLADADNEIHLLEKNLLYEVAGQLGLEKNLVDKITQGV